MNLVTRFLAARRDKLLMQLGCWLVCFSLVLGLILPQQRAEALVAELAIGSVSALAASYLCACGLPLVTQGMDRDALVSSVQRLIQEFLDTELGGITIQDWLGNVWDLTVMAGKLIMGRPLTEEFVSFAQWVAGKYVVQAGENVVYSDQTVTFPDGSVYTLATIVPDPNVSYLVSWGTTIPYGTEENPFIIQLDDTYKITVWRSGSRFYFRGMSGKLGSFSNSNYTGSADDVKLSFFLIEPSNVSDSKCLVIALPWYNTHVSRFCLNYNSVSYVVAGPLLDSMLSGTNLSIDCEDEALVYIPPGITVEQGVALDVGAAATMDLDLVLQGVLDDVLAGELTSIMEAAGEEVVDPPADEITDVDNLGLPALGQALTSRFPFSIPWDFFRAVQLLAAPAKAPYFEVDFMEPLADDVGGWQGDTTVILDFSEYAIIGQISRWTSTIGFCLMLAGATKRLIWTA